VDYFFAPDRIDLPEFTLRSHEPGDGPLLAATIRQSYEHLKAFIEWAQPDYDDELAEQMVRKFRARYLLAEGFVMGIYSPDGNRCLGGTGFHLREGPLSTGNAEIGMWIHGEHAGKGFGTRVLVALLRWGFEEWPWQRLSWKCDTRNIASAKVAEKAGMQREGCLRQNLPVKDNTERHDTYIYATLRDEWLAQHRE
jgi:RimJ/RimL family protein N-acetyltransferase